MGIPSTKWPLRNWQTLTASLQHTRPALAYGVPCPERTVSTISFGCFSAFKCFSRFSFSFIPRPPPETPCEEKPCKHQDKCIPFYTNNTYKCIPGCGQGWLQFDNNCYFFNHDPSKPAHWNDAANVCQLLGGHLVDIRNEYEWQFVKSNLKRAGDAYAQYIIGMTDAASEGHWKYTDGTAASFFKWNAGEPSGGTSENCGSIFSDANIGSYNDGSCTYNYGRFICKKGAGQ
ncbi:perlucin-like protein [Actinia tenebrosa]|uniref:Perlucin-like protein n=1 Tax=Actinia tenebrosa TaxID=6105 RepID=A0A6P8I2E8_ACTTE|nr:perlucin-like protein [Actinia tenebrosa]